MIAPALPVIAGLPICAEEIERIEIEREEHRVDYPMQPAAMDEIGGLDSVALHAIAGNRGVKPFVVELSYFQ